MKLMILIMMFIIYISSAEDEKASIPIWVRRRLSNDFYRTTDDSQDAKTVCDDKGMNITFLVSEKRCVKSQDLFNGTFEYACVRY